MERWAGRLALALILALAAVLRFAALDWGLRHPVHLDERVYVENVVRMVEAGDLDHRFYTYPGLFFYLLAPGVAWLGAPRWWTNDATLVSRAFVAGWGVLNVALVYLVGSRLLGRAAGLTAALLLAVSPVDVRTSHQVRPDVLLEGLGVLALVQFRRLGERLGQDARAGLLMGATTAIKFSGLFLVPFYLAARLLARGPRLRGMAVAGALAAGVTLAATPYALLHAERYRRGPGLQLEMYYKDRPRQEPAFLKHAAYYADAGVRAVGPLGALLFLAGAAVALRREPRAWGPALLHPLTTVVVMSTASMAFPRLILPGMGVVHVLAGLPVGLVARRSRVAAVALALAAAALPLRGSARYVNFAAQPSPADRALDWFEARYGPGTRVVETRIEGVEPGVAAGAMIGFDRTRVDLVSHAEMDAGLRLLAPHADLIVTGGGGGGFWGDSLLIMYEGHAHRPPRTWHRLGPSREDGPVVLRFAVPRRRMACTPVDLSLARLASSQGESALQALRDDDPGTSWSTKRPLAGGEWLRVELDLPADLGRVELVLGNAPARYGPDLELRTSADLVTYAPVISAAARPSIAEQLEAARLGDRRPLGQVRVLDPRPVRGLEIRQVGGRDEPWSIAELRLGECRLAD